MCGAKTHAARYILTRPSTWDGLFRFTPPTDFAACTAVTPGDARDESASDLRKLITKLHVNCGHASARQPARAFADSESGASHLVNYVNEVLGHREVRRAFD